MSFPLFLLFEYAQGSVSLFFFSSRRRHTRWPRDWSFRRVLFRSQGWNPQPPATTGAVRERWDSLNALVGLADTVLARPGTGLAEVVRELEERAEAQSAPVVDGVTLASVQDRKSTRLNSSHVAISYAVFCLKKNQR